MKFLIELICILLLSISANAVDIIDELDDSADIEPALPSLPPDMVDQVLEKSVLFSPQDFINARLIGSRYRSKFDEAKAHWERQIQQSQADLRRAWGYMYARDLHLEESMDPIDDLIHLTKLYDHVGISKRHQFIEFGEGLAFVGGSIGPNPPYGIGMGNSEITAYNGCKSKLKFQKIDGHVVFDMQLVTPNNRVIAEKTWTLPCRIDQLMRSGSEYRLIYAYNHNDMMELFKGENDRKPIRLWFMVYEFVPIIIRGICGGMAYLYSPTDRDISQEINSEN